MSGCIAVSSVVQRGGSLVALDPGIRSPAVAVFTRFEHGWVLTDARRATSKSGDDPLRRASALSLELAIVLEHCVASAFVTEYPEVRGAGRGKGSAADLIPMALLAGALAAELDVEPSACATVTPSEWAGSTPKATRGDPRKAVRGARVWDELHDEERELLERLKLLQHDAFDAVGIGLYAVGRVGTGVTQRRSRVEPPAPLATKP